MRILPFVLISTGAFVLWAINGFKGQFNDHMVSRTDDFSAKGIVRMLIGLGIWLAIIVTANRILSRPSPTEVYEIQTNEKGEIINSRRVR